AFQSSGLALLILGSLIVCRGKMRLSKFVRAYILLSATLVLWIIVSGWLNPANPWKQSFAMLLGYLPWMILPAFAAPVLSSLEGRQRLRLQQISLGILLAWGLVVLSQYIFPWKVAGSSIV